MPAKISAGHCRGTAGRCCGTSARGGRSCAAASASPSAVGARGRQSAPPPAASASDSAVDRPTAGRRAPTTRLGAFSRVLMKGIYLPGSRIREKDHKPIHPNADNVCLIFFFRQDLRCCANKIYFEGYKIRHKLASSGLGGATKRSVPDQVVEDLNIKIPDHKKRAPLWSYNAHVSLRSKTEAASWLTFTIGV